MVKGRVGKITAFDGSTGEYLVMLGSKNERCSESEIEKLSVNNNGHKKSDLVRKKKPVHKKTI
jgi:hypothetical protein